MCGHLGIYKHRVFFLVWSQVKQLYRKIGILISEFSIQERLIFAYLTNAESHTLKPLRHREFLAFKYLS